MSETTTAVTLDNARDNIGAAVVYEPYPGGPREDGVIRGVSQTVVWVHYSWQRNDADAQGTMPHDLRFATAVPA